MPPPLSSLASDLAALVLPSPCPGCGRATEDRLSVLCRRCTVDVGRCLTGGGGPTLPSPVPPGFPPTWAGAPLSPELARLVTAHKDRGRRDLAPVLARMLAPAVRAASAGYAYPVVIVPVPASPRSRRVRGDRPMEALAVACAEHLPGHPRVVRALDLNRSPRDQSRLGHHERARNVAGAMTLRDGGRELRQGLVVLVDDVVTTGSTLTEAARTLGAGGIRCRAAVVAATQRRTVAADGSGD